MEIRCMTERDVAAVAALEKLCFSLPWDEKSVRSELTNPLSLWLVAVQEGAFAGYIGSQSVMGEADMMNLAVAPEYRGLGIGEALVTELICRLSQNLVSSLTLEVRESNVAAGKLYTKLGFMQVGCRPGYYTKPKENALILRKEWSV